MKTITVTATEVRKNLFELINAAKFGQQVTIITTNGKTAAKIVPAKETEFDWQKYFKELPRLKNLFTDDDLKQMRSFRKNFKFKR